MPGPGYMYYPSLQPAFRPELPPLASARGAVPPSLLPGNATRLPARPILIGVGPIGRNDPISTPGPTSLSGLYGSVRHRDGYRPPGSWSPRPANYDDYDGLNDNHEEFEPYGYYGYSSDSDDETDFFTYLALRKSVGDQEHTTLRGGYECQFVESTSSDLQTECSICLSILRRPYLVDCCGYRFCHSCIETIQNSHKPCPLCNTESFKTFPDKQLQRMLNQKQVYCKHKVDGCEWTGELSKFAEHFNSPGEETGESRLEGCPYVALKCSTCEKLIKRAEFKAHEVRCSDDTYTCEYCNSFTSTYSDVINNHWPKCKSHPVPCPNECGEDLKRSEVDMHVTCECELTVVQCDFADSGCEVKLTRIEMADHVEVGALDHISLLASKNSALMKTNHEATGEIDSLMEDCADLAFEVHCLSEDNSNLFSQNCFLQEEVAEKEAETTALKKKLAQAEEQLQRWQEQKRNPAATVSVENLPFDVNEQKLKSLFGPFGRVLRVHMTSSSIASIVFEQPEAVERALARSKDPQGLKLHKQRLKVSRIKNI